MVFTEFLNNEADKIAELDLSKEKGIDANENELKKNLDSVEEIDINYNKAKSYEQSNQKDMALLNLVIIMKA